MLSPPQVQLHRIVPVAITSSGLELEIELHVSNPNRSDLTLLGYSYTLQVAALPFSSGSSRQTIIFPGTHTTLVRIPALIKYANLLELLKQQPNPETLPYQINATLQLDGPLGEQTVPVRYSGQFSIPEQYRPTGLFRHLQNLLSPHSSPFSLAQ